MMSRPPHSLRLLLVLACGGFTFVARGADLVRAWNEVARQAYRDEFLSSSPGRASRGFAMLHLTLFDVLNAIEPRYRGYLYESLAPRRDVSTESALATAGCAIMTSLLPVFIEDFESARDTQLAAVPAGPQREAGIELGREIAGRMIDVRQYDGSTSPALYMQQTGPGVWRPTPPGYGIPTTPQWGAVKPFILPRKELFLIQPPPALGSAEYAAAYDDVRIMGALDSTSRTAEQALIGAFWAYDRAGMGSPLVLFNSALYEILDTMALDALDRARVVALANAAMADEAIMIWEAKYRYNVWRPITGIREGDADLNPLTAGETQWRPLGAPGDGLFPDFTPPFPAYPSGHSGFGWALFHLLSELFGDEATTFTLTSGELPGVTRTFHRFSDAAAENGRSRIYLGVHWQFDNTGGEASGKQVAEYVATHALALRRAGAGGWADYE